MLRLYLRLLTVVSLLAFPVMSQEWPEQLAYPMPSDSVDSSSAGISSSQDGKILLPGDSGKYLVNFWNSSNELFLCKNDSSKYVRQNVLYEASLNSLNSRKHALTLNGELIKKRFLFASSYAGLEWDPQIIMNGNREQSDLRGSIRIGPVAGIVVKGVPVRVMAGGALDVWNEEMPASVTDYGYTELSDSRNDLGLYGGLNAGGFEKELLPGLPLFAAVSGFVREQDSANTARTTIGSLYMFDAGTGDSIFLFAADSFSAGKSGLMNEQSDGKIQYNSTSHRIRHAFSASAGLRLRPRFHFSQAAAYEYSYSTVYFPDMPNDEKIRMHSVTLMLKSDETFFLDYSGIMKFGFNSEDWMYRFDIPSVNTSYSGYSLNILTMNLLDNNEQLTFMGHKISKKLDNGMGLSYSFDISRSSTSYPVYYINYGDTVFSNRDRDRINQHHQAAFTIIDRELIGITAGGEFIKDIFSYIKSENSAMNSTMKIYNITLGLKLKPFKPLSIEEKAGANATLTEYQFPSYASGFPPYYRWFDSRLSGNLAIKPWLSLDGQWYAKYRDDGQWEVPAPNDTLRSDLKEGYYAVTEKSMETMLELAATAVIREKYSVRAGATFKDYHDLEYQDDAYVNRQGTTGYIMIPFFKILASVENRVNAAVSISRYIDTEADGYWNIGGSINVVF
jgi:hypothetical protein